MHFICTLVFLAAHLDFLVSGSHIIIEGKENILADALSCNYLSFVLSFAIWIFCSGYEKLFT